MQKQCSRCRATKFFAEFSRRTLSRDGYAAACTECRRKEQQIRYWGDPAERQETIARAGRTKQARFASDPAYKRAFNLWGAARKRKSKIPPWVSIVDFVPICRKAIKKGPEYEIDHVIPLNHPLVCGLHVPANLRVVLRETNLAKGNRFDLS